MADMLTPIETLDLILKKLKEFERIKWIDYDGLYSTIHNANKIKVILEEYTKEVEKISFNRAVDKLANHKLIDFRKNPQNDNVKEYRINFDGVLFIENGGYSQIEADKVQQRERLKIDAQRIEDNEKWLKRGAVGAAIGSFAYLIWDILKYCMEHVWCNCS